MRVPLAVLLAFALAACGDAGPSVAAGGGGSITILLAGDVMLGRGVAPVVAADPGGIFEGIRHLTAGADLALANLESPLTLAPHVAIHPYRLQADPATAAVLATAGFDAVGLANNHVGDSGPAGVTDTLAALSAAGVDGVGAGADASAAAAPWIARIEGVTVAVLAFDASHLGLPAGLEAGVGVWDEEMARDLLRDVRGIADVVIVGVHGGAGYVSRDAHLDRIAELVAGWGADVVWGHGAHVPHAVTVSGDGPRRTVVATGLGDLMFDGLERRGALLELIVDRSGVLAYRTARVSHPDLRVRLDGWDAPSGDAGLIGHDWWQPVRSPSPAPATATDAAGFPWGDVVAAGVGDVTGDGEPDTVVSFRRPFRETLLNRTRPDVQWADRAGRSAHLGVFDTAQAWRQQWVAGTLFRPVAALAVCDGAIAVAYDRLDDTAVTGGGAWWWHGFGFMGATDLEGALVPACADVDGDGRLDPVLLREGAS